MKRKAVLWIVGYSSLVILMLGFVAFWTIRIDPFFHYHKPLVNDYYYPLNNERSQNNGIIRNFDYQGLIIGTSMTQCFKPSEAESLWGINFIKTPFSGATFKEINDNIANALKVNPELKIVIRGLDIGMFGEDKDLMRVDLGTYPTYLYDDNVFNDVHYIFNRDVVFSRVIPMAKNEEKKYGITSFDDYANWSKTSDFGKNVLYPDGVPILEPGTPIHLTDSGKKSIIDNIQQNVVSLADEYPDVEFLYFFTPYGIKWWQTVLEYGTIYSHNEAERTVIEQILGHENIKLFSFSNQLDITTDLNNYTNAEHYGEWINSLILKYMYDGKCLITSDNYEKYLSDQLSFYTSYDYGSLNEQEDYENDYEAEIKMVEKVYGIKGEELSLDSELIQLSNATIIEDQYQGKPGVLCQGCLQRAPTEGTDSDYIRDVDFVGIKYHIDDVKPIRFIVFQGKKITDAGMPHVYVYDSAGDVVAYCGEHYTKLDNEWHQYYLDVAGIEGEVTIVFNGGYVDRTGPDSQFVFSDILFY